MYCMYSLKIISVVNDVLHFSDRQDKVTFDSCAYVGLLISIFQHCSLLGICTYVMHSTYVMFFFFLL